MRRLFQHRASAIVAVAVIVTTVLGLIGAGEFRSWRDHDSLVRHGRGSSQRLRTPDAVSHEDESPDLLVAPVHSGLFVPDASLGSVTRSSVHAPPGPLIMPIRGPHFGPDLDFVLLAYAESSSPVVSNSLRPSLGRAPPLA